MMLYTTPTTTESGMDNVLDSKHERLALVLRGGGVKGLAYAGAIEVFEEFEIKFDTYVGTSAGAISAVLLAAGYKGKDLARELKDFGFHRFLSRFLPIKIANIALMDGIHSGTRLTQWISDLLRKK